MLLNIRILDPGYVLYLILQRIFTLTRKHGILFLSTIFESQGQPKLRPPLIFFPVSLYLSMEIKFASAELLLKVYVCYFLHFI